MSMAQALVTGGFGFIGSRVASRLEAEGTEVLRLGRSPLKSGARTNAGLSVLGSWKTKPDIVVHCAGPPTVGAVAADPGADFRSSVLGSVELLERIASQVPSARIVFCSSAAVYGNEDVALLSESRCPAPMSAYGTHKLLIELILRQRCQQLGLRGAIVRLFSVYGEGLRKQLFWDACNKLSRGEATFFGTGAEVRDFIHVDDATELILLAAAQASKDCPVVNGGTGRALTIDEALKDTARGVGSAIEPVFGGEKHTGNPGRLCADMTLATSWGFSPKVPWEEGIGRYCDWFGGLGE